MTSTKPIEGLPILFGTAVYQQTLMRLHAEGVAFGLPEETIRGLLYGGLVLRYVQHGRSFTALDPRFPAYGELLQTLGALTGAKHEPPPLPEELPDFEMETKRPLAFPNFVMFRVLIELTSAPDGLSYVNLKARLHDHMGTAVRASLDALLKRSVILEDDGHIRLSPAVPEAYAALVIRTAAALAETDPRFVPHPQLEGARVSAFQAAKDGAPRLFASDVRLRNLMALARHGPLLNRELRRIVGTNHYKIENEDQAIFGRGALARTWTTDKGPAVMLDPDFPLHGELRALLLALERHYPLDEYVPERAAPEPPPRRKWTGDRHSMFGDIIPTSILTIIGVHGWTYEAVCCKAINHDRFNVKKAMRRLEDEGVLQGDRPRKPGNNIRVVTISDDFVAKVELGALLRAYVREWPETAATVKRGFDAIFQINPKSKVQLIRRGLWPY